MSAEPPEPRELVTRDDREWGVVQGDGEPDEPIVWLWGYDGPYSRSWAGQGWLALDRADLEWLRDVALPAMLAELERRTLRP